MAHQDTLCVLHVPYDNDMRFRFNAVALDQPDQRVTSNEVTTIYENASRGGFVFGSLTHNVWKTSLNLHAQNGSLKDIEVFGGLQGRLGERSDTHDFVAHGVVSGRKVLSSPYWWESSVTGEVAWKLTANEMPNCIRRSPGPATSIGLE